MCGFLFLKKSWKKSKTIVKYRQNHFLFAESCLFSGARSVEGGVCGEEGWCVDFCF